MFPKRQPLTATEKFGGFVNTVGTLGRLQSTHVTAGAVALSVRNGTESVISGAEKTDRLFSLNVKESRLSAASIPVYCSPIVQFEPPFGK